MSAKAQIGLLAGLALFDALLALPAPEGFSRNAWRVTALAVMVPIGQSIIHGMGAGRGR